MLNAPGRGRSRGLPQPAVLPGYVPASVSEAVAITTTNSLQSVRPSPFPSGVLGPAAGLGDYSGGAVSRWAGTHGKHLVHGGGHAISNDASVYAISFGPSSVSWERLIGMPNLEDYGKFVAYTPANANYGATSYDYFIAKGTNSTLPADPDNASGWGTSDAPGSNPREVYPGWPGSAHTYDALCVIPPAWGGGGQGALIRGVAMAIGISVSRETFYSHYFQIGGSAWGRFDTFESNYSTTWSFDSLRGRLKDPFRRGYRQFPTGNWVTVSGSVSGLPSSYVDNRLSEYHAARDIHVFVGNTEAETTAGSASNWAWWAGGDDNGTRTAVTWTGSAPPNMAATTSKTGQSSMFYIEVLGQLFYYSRKDADAYFLIDVPSNPADAWTATRYAMTGTGRPSLNTPHDAVYGRMDWVPALKCVSFVPLSSNTSDTLNKTILIRVQA